MIEKKDWEDLKKQLTINHKNMLMAQAQDEVLLKMCDEKLKEFPEDPMPEEAKAIVDDGARIVDIRT